MEPLEPLWIRHCYMYMYNNMEVLEGFTELVVSVVYLRVQSSSTWEDVLFLTKTPPSPSTISPHSSKISSPGSGNVVGSPGLVVTGLNPSTHSNIAEAPAGNGGTGAVL